MKEPHSTTHVPIIVGGGGQAGLAVGYYLTKLGFRFLILDASEHVGDAWRHRYDSLRLFSPARNSGLPGMRLPLRGDSFPTKDQMAEYLEAYAMRFELPVRSGVRVEELTREGDSFVVRTSDHEYVCDQVIVAMAGYQNPRTPAFASQLDESVFQLHSRDYRNPSQLQPGKVLVVGVGNSGADIALEVSRAHETWLSGKETGAIPVAIESPFARHLVSRLIRFIGHHVLTIDSGPGRNLRPKMLHRAQPLIRVRGPELAKAGVHRVERVVGVEAGRPVLADGQTLDVANVIWSTGYAHGFPWIHIPIFDSAGDPRHHRGVVSEAPGLYFVGLHFLYAMSSATLTGVGRDAAYIVKKVAERERGVVARPAAEIASKRSAA